MRAPNRLLIWAGIVGIALVLGTFTSAQHVRSRVPRELMWEQLVRHNAVLDGAAGNPWQYRILTAHLVEPWRDLLGNYLPLGVAAGAAFLSFRILLDSLILLLAVLYYRKLGLTLPSALIGIAMLAWGMSYAHFDADLSFSTYLDVVFYLVAALLLMSGRYWWLVPLAALAALNRETGALIPFMGLSFLAFERDQRQRRALIIASSIAAVILVTVLISLRVHYGPQELIDAYGHVPGFDLARYNVTRLVTWAQVLATLSIVPLIALVGYRTWPPQLKAFFWVVGPAWMLVHLFGALLAESRLLIVPSALLFIPGALFLVQHSVLEDAKLARTNPSGASQGSDPHDLPVPLNEPGC